MERNRVLKSKPLGRRLAVCCKNARLWHLESVYGEGYSSLVEEGRERESERERCSAVRCVVVPPVECIDFCSNLLSAF